MKLTKNKTMTRTLTILNIIAYLIQLLEGMENRFSSGKAVTEDFGEFMDKIII